MESFEPTQFLIFYLRFSTNPSEIAYVRKDLWKIVDRWTILMSNSRHDSPITHDSRGGTGCTGAR